MDSLLSGEGPTIMTSFNPTYLLNPRLSPIQSIMMYLLIVLLAHILCSEIMIFPYMYMMYFDHFHSLPSFVRVSQCSYFAQRVPLL